MNTKSILNLIVIIIISFLGLFACKTTQETKQSMLNISLVQTSEMPAMNIIFYEGESFNHPTFALWLEDLHGKLIKTIYVTKSYASGIFEHEMVGDSIWDKTSFSTNGV